LSKLADPIRYSPILEGSLKNLIASVKAQGLEGLVAKRRDSKYEPGLRSGAWQKMRVRWNSFDHSRTETSIGVGLLFWPCLRWQLLLCCYA
jgi:ATP-dependent DNA ligase